MLVVKWFREWVAERRAERERLFEMHSAAEEFLAMSKGAKVLLSKYDYFLPIVSDADVLIVSDYRMLNNFFARHYFNTLHYSYGDRNVYQFAKDDYNLLRGRHDVGEFSSEDLKGMLFDEGRLRRLSGVHHFGLSSITVDEWSLVTTMYIRYVAEFKSREVAFQRNLLAAKSNHESQFRQLAYVSQALNEIVSSSSGGGNGESLSTSTSEARWLEAFGSDSFAGSGFAER